MNATPKDTASRRGFLTRVLTAAPVVAAGGILATPARAAAANLPRSLRVGGVAIAGHVVGPVVVRGAEYDYLLYDACRTTRRGAEAAGVAVVRLTDCVVWRLRGGGDSHLRGRAADPAELDECQTYRIDNSTWVAELVDEDPGLGRCDAPRLHHLVFTFRETHFECVVSRYDVAVHTGAFAGLVARLSADGAG